MKIRAIVHTVPESEGGGYWAEVPALPGCMTQGETYDELLRNIQEAVEGWLSTDGQPGTVGAGDQYVVSLNMRRSSCGGAGRATLGAGWTNGTSARDPRRPCA
ncbi:MAG: type II toxin-antitoxin system HicB family antitoxin [Chloroflexi bacterium]|nr:type II toxin-antitoxin system HicB family antitoxin [Chloroflexota bacterium]